MWDEMGLDLDDFYVDRIHRLGSLHRAKQRNANQNPRRHIIVAFNNYSSTEIIMETAYMLKGTNFSVTRDYPKENVEARKGLMPLYREQRQIRGNKVSLEFPAKLVVNGKIIADAFPDWYNVLQTDRLRMLNENFMCTPTNAQYHFQQEQEKVNDIHSQPQPQPPAQLRDMLRSNISETHTDTHQQDDRRTYAEVIMSDRPKSTQTIVQNQRVPSSVPTSVPANIPRYTHVTAAGGNGVGNHDRTQQDISGQNDCRGSASDSPNKQQTDLTVNEQPSYIQL